VADVGWSVWFPSRRRHEDNDQSQNHNQFFSTTHLQLYPSIVVVVIYGSINTITDLRGVNNNNNNSGRVFSPKEEG
jgi:hypothetical protein